jgi:hypothetical protein
MLKYTAKITQPQTVGKIRLNPKGGTLTNKELKAIRKDTYGVSLLEKGLLVVEESSAAPLAGNHRFPDFDNTAA